MKTTVVQREGIIDGECVFRVAILPHCTEMMMDEDLLLQLIAALIVASKSLARLILSDNPLWCALLSQRVFTPSYAFEFMEGKTPTLFRLENINYDRPSIGDMLLLYDAGGYYPASLLSYWLMALNTALLSYHEPLFSDFRQSSPCDYADYLEQLFAELDGCEVCERVCHHILEGEKCVTLYDLVNMLYSIGSVRKILSPVTMLFLKSLLAKKESLARWREIIDDGISSFLEPLRSRIKGNTFVENYIRALPSHKEFVKNSCLYYVNFTDPCITSSGVVFRRALSI